MKKKLSWISSTSKGFIAAFLDLILIFFFIFLQTYFLTGNLFSSSFLYIWILGSYISGRYSDDDKSFSVSLYSESIKLITTILISLIFNLSFNIFQFAEKFSLNFAIIFFLSSFTIQFLFKLNYENKKNKYLHWLVLASDNDLTQLKKYLKEINNPIKLKKLNLDKHNHEYIKNNFRGIIVTKDQIISEEQISKIKILESYDVRIKSKVSWCEYVMQRIPTELINESEIINKDFLKISNSFTLRIKRIGDITLSIFLIVLTSPILLISSFLIWWTDKGPVFYSQIRSGYKGKTFRVWKLRSMRVNAEKDSNPLWAAKNDPRITKVGTFLRKCRIDELPQLINVINGSMSLIGPRPERPEIEETLTKKIKNYYIRSYVKPGLSGWAQVNYPYGASILDSKIKSSYDVFYIRNQSILMDFLIFFKTIKLVFNLRGSEPIYKNNN